MQGVSGHSATYTQVKCIVMQGVSGHSATSVFITQRIELCGAMLDRGSGCIPPAASALRARGRAS